MILATYLCRRKDFSITKWLNSLKGGSTFWKQVVLNMFFFILAFIFTNILENMLPHLNAGMIKLRADNLLKTRPVYGLYNNISSNCRRSFL